MSTNAEVVHRWFEEVWNQRDLAIVDELLSKDSISHGLMDDKGNLRRGPAGFRMLFDAFTSAYPDMNVTIEKTVSEGDYVVVHVVVKGTHLGEGIGVAPTDREVKFGGFCLIRVEGGKIVEAWNQYDFMTMYQQLGVLSLTLE
jgi:steroid delta-isomerase-like uncharacterized protein